ncbi:hypothetical protein GCM10027277_49940 [Pseudoduganella ginsengisoli]|uniref:Uncharacterized protein n=1 Tax=Pseudoduganella ginsengisoli TaxID=1462440 RepID=A0A6L6Q662_9BURK|nr:hypothetical protein [Pseudoduganella ginsengisoli]MTW04612.1 hypothetical protein [Pseudoduganella ginsengisoli]
MLAGTRTLRTAGGESVPVPVGDFAWRVLHEVAGADVPTPASLMIGEAYRPGLKDARSVSLPGSKGVTGYSCCRKPSEL